MLQILDAYGNEIEKIDIADKSSDQLGQLLEEKGFNLFVKGLPLYISQREIFEKFLEFHKKYHKKIGIIHQKFV